jgi:hypothetical protein
LSPLAKTATNIATPVESTATDTSSQSMNFDGIPLDFYRLFSIDLGTIPTKEVDKLKTIYEWSKDGSETMGDMMQKVSRLESQLGSPAINEKRYDKMVRYIKMSKAIGDLEKQRDSLARRSFI